MTPRHRIFLLILIMTLLVIISESVTIKMLYDTAFEEERARLVETAKSQAMLIEAMGRFNSDYHNEYPLGPREATLAQIRDAHSRYQGFGNTGEFTLSQRDGDAIVFLLNHRHYDLDNPKPVHWNSKLAEPMRRALSGESGTIVGLDYRGVKVLAAHEPLEEMGLGIVAKIDLSEIRAPFIKAVLWSGLIALVLILAGTTVFIKVSEPIITKLHMTVSQLEKSLSEVKTLKGIVPICSYCKKIRDDQGYWAQVESYISKHTNADFSHGICPDCMAEHFPDI